MKLYEKLKTIKLVLKERGLLGLLAVSINIFLTRAMGVRIVKSNSIAGNPTARKVFSKCSLSYSNDGYYFLNPMPSVDDLNAYYSSLYWGSRAGKNYGVSTRDIVHFEILKEYVSDILVEGRVFMNFGAGHGGISNLCWLEGMEIVNVEPSLLPQFYKERWNTLKDIRNVKNNSVDLMYGSHSLEHVQNIDAFKAEVMRVLKPGGFVFWEVPNAECPSNGAQRGKVDIPHTYYFEKTFFDKWFSRTILCGGYEQSHQFDVIQDWKSFENDKSPVIRALGQIDKILDT